MGFSRHCGFKIGIDQNRQKVDLLMSLPCVMNQRGGPVETHTSFSTRSFAYRSLGVHRMSDAVQGPGERSIGDSGVADTGPVNNGLECEETNIVRTPNAVSILVRLVSAKPGCGSDDDCPSTQPTCELYGEGDGLCIRQYKTMACGEGEDSESRDLGFWCLRIRPTERQHRVWRQWWGWWQRLVR